MPPRRQWQHSDTRSQGKSGGSYAQLDRPPGRLLRPRTLETGIRAIVAGASGRRRTSASPATLPWRSGSTATDMLRATFPPEDRKAPDPP